MASSRWLVAHLLGMVAFALLALALARAGRELAPGSRAAAVLGPLGALAAFLLLPYYGGEAYGLHAVGQHAVATGDLSVLGVVDGFRYQPLAITTFGLGLLAVAAAGLLAVVAVRRQRPALRWAVLVVAVGLAGYLPQFFAPAPVRVAHGVLLGLGCLAVARLAHRAAQAAPQVAVSLGVVPRSAASRG